MNKTIKYGFFFLLAVIAVIYALNRNSGQAKYPPPNVAAGTEGPAAVPVQGGEPVSAVHAKPLFSFQDKEVRLAGIDDNRISQDFEKAKKAEQEAIRADAEAVKKSDIDEKKAQSELEKIAQAKEEAAKSSQK